MLKKKRNVEKIVDGIPVKIPRGKGRKIATIVLIILALVLIAVVGFLGFKFYEMQKELSMLKDPKKAEELAKKEVQVVVDKVGVHMILPTDEEPTLASITDIEALKKEQPFYEGCENGDQILVYQKAKIGIVYSPSKDKIVKVGPVVMQDDSTAGAGTSSGADSSSASSTYDDTPASTTGNSAPTYNQYDTGN